MVIIALYGNNLASCPSGNPKFEALFMEGDPKKVARLNQQRRLAHRHPHVSYTNYHATIDRLFDGGHFNAIFINTLISAM